MECFLMSFQGMKGVSKKEDKVICPRLKNGKFSFKARCTNFKPKRTFLLLASGLFAWETT